jgi:hypothetical protein
VSGRAHLRFFRSCPWEDGFGDPSDPVTVLGVEVERTLCSRDTPPSALVGLLDRRCALTGAVLAVGPPAQLREYLLGRRAHASDDERRWLEQCIEQLRSEHTRHRVPDGLGAMNISA